MPTIDAENTKKIRQPFEVHCGITAEDKRHTATITTAPTTALQDSNASASVANSGWPILQLADLASGGFTLDTGAVFPVANHTAGESGKYGYQSDVGAGMTFTISTAATALSFQTSGSGTMTVRGRSYPLTPYMVVDVSGGTASKTFTIINDDPNSRVCIYAMSPGVTLQFDNETLVSVVLDLAGSLSIDETSFETSSIEIVAYHPADIASVITQLAEDTPLWYYAGYSGDYCKTRRFYLDGDAVQSRDGTITLKGTDASHRLENRTVAPIAHKSGVQGSGYPGAAGIYNTVKDTITKAGIKLVYAEKSTIPTGGQGQFGRYVVVKSQNAQDFIGAAMVDLRTAPEEYWITYVDAGIPSLAYKYKQLQGQYVPPWQSRLWEIREEDTQDPERTISKKINAVYNSDDTDSLRCTLSARLRDGRRSYGTKQDVDAGDVCSASVDGYAIRGVVQNCEKILYIDAASVKWITEKSGTTGYYAIPLIETSRVEKATKNQNGVPIRIDPALKGWAYAPGGVVPNYNRRFDASNITGSFTFRGDPRMQPRDVFRFVRLDGTVEIATIERIEMTHEGGGTTAEVHYRLGVC